MAVTVRIQAPLRKLTGGLDKTEIVCQDLCGCIDVLEEQFNGIRERLCDDTGELRHFVNVYINGEDVRFLDGLSTAIKSGDEISIVPAVAGG